MGKEVMMRRVSMDGTFCFQGKRYVIERPGFVRKWIVVHYDNQADVVRKVESEMIGESSVHLLVFGGFQEDRE